MSEINAKPEMPGMLIDNGERGYLQIEGVWEGMAFLRGGVFTCHSSLKLARDGRRDAWFSPQLPNGSLGEQQAIGKVLVDKSKWKRGGFGVDPYPFFTATMLQGGAA